MPTNQEQSAQIERYIAGEMPEKERQAFEAALKRDPDLAEALALHQALQHSLGNKERRQLLDVLADVVEQEAKKRPVPMLQWLSPYRMALAAVLLVFVVAVGLWVYRRPHAEPPAVAEAPVVLPQPRPESGATKTGPPPVEQIRKPQPQPLASADRRAFEPNTALDPLVGTLVRGGTAEIAVTSPENDAVFPLRNGTFNFAIEGSAKELTAVILRIYNNRSADFIGDKTEYLFEIPVNDNAFAWETALKLAPGCYYAVLSAPGDEEMVLVLRFYAGSR